MSLESAARRILVSRSTQTTDIEWTEARREFEEALAQHPSPDELHAVLEADVDNQLPVDLKSAVYEELIRINPKAAALLRAYAWHLQLHGPDCDDYAIELLTEADRLDVI